MGSIPFGMLKNFEPRNKVDEILERFPADLVPKTGRRTGILWPMQAITFWTMTCFAVPHGDLSQYLFQK